MFRTWSPVSRSSITAPTGNCSANLSRFSAAVILATSVSLLRSEAYSWKVMFASLMTMVVVAVLDFTPQSDRWQPQPPSIVSLPSQIQLSSTGSPSGTNEKSLLRAPCVCFVAVRIFICVV